MEVRKTRGREEGERKEEGGRREEGGRKEEGGRREEGGGREKRRKGEGHAPGVVPTASG